MRSLFILAALVATVSDVYPRTSGFTLLFDELPYSEGTLYVSASAGEREILARMAEVEGDSVLVPVEYDGVAGESVTVNAFLDLNDNRQLDFDTYGRPVEPCLRTTVVLSEEKNIHELKLISY